jgi:hypothetical protein
MYGLFSLQKQEPSSLHECIDPAEKQKHLMLVVGLVRRECSLAIPMTGMKN